MKTKGLSVLLTVIGLGLLAVGIYLIKAVSEPEGVMLALPYVCVGVGCGVFGTGMGDIISRRAIKKNPDLGQQIEIAKNDERNIAIARRAKAMAYDRMIYVYSALMLAFTLMGVDLIPSLLLVFAYLFVIGCSIYYRCKYDREM